MIEDEHTIPRPRWVVPVAVAGLAFLVLGLVLAVALSGGDDTEVRFTGGTTTTVVTTTVVTTTSR